MRMHAILFAAAAMLAPACGGGPSEDPCANVVCDQPPIDSCLDEDTLLVYEVEGSCDPATGLCVYLPSEQTCAHGCEDGACVSGGSVWGWISVFELNDARQNADANWNGGVRACFAEAGHQRLALEHEKGPLGGALVARAGGCALYESEWQDPWRCDPPCEAADQECVTEDAQDVCRAIPRRLDAGSLQIDDPDGTLTLEIDDLGRHAATTAPDELFGAGDTIRVEADGGELKAFEIETRGVAHLEVPDQDVQLVAGQATTVGWVSADPGSRVQVVLLSGPHHPSPPVAAIVCDAPDEDGRVEIAAGLVDGFLERTWVANWFSQALRYRAAQKQLSGGAIELRVGSMRQLNLLWRQ